MDLIETGRAAAEEIRRRPGQSTAAIASAIGATETQTYVALYRLGRHFAVGLTAVDGWHSAGSSGEIAERLFDPALPPCPAASGDEHAAAAGA